MVVVDEAVLALSDYELADPLAAFYAQLVRHACTPCTAGRPSCSPTRQPVAAAARRRRRATAVDDRRRSRHGARSASDNGPPAGNESAAAARARVTPRPARRRRRRQPIDVRTNFDALAVFEPTSPPTPTGKATVDVPLPDNLTRYRVMVVAVAGADQFGSAESNITARLPLMVRPSAPRFLNFGDRSSCRSWCRTRPTSRWTSTSSLQTANLDHRRRRPASGSTCRPTTGSRSASRSRPIKPAPPGSGSPRSAATLADAATVELPVYTPATPEAFATYGVHRRRRDRPTVLAPTDVIPQFGGLDITTSSTSLQALTDAVLYLADYPYDSSDALASRILAIAALRDVLDAFDAAGLPPTGSARRRGRDDIAASSALQNDDGGFPYWARDARSEPFNTIQATHALVLARQGGYAVPRATLDLALSYLADIESTSRPSTDEAARDTLSAYALYVRALAGDRDPAKAQDARTSRGRQLQLDAIAWLWPSIDDPATRRRDRTRCSNKRASRPPARPTSRPATATTPT